MSENNPTDNADLRLCQGRDDEATTSTSTGSRGPRGKNAQYYRDYRARKRAKQEKESLNRTSDPSTTAYSSTINVAGKVTSKIRKSAAEYQREYRARKKAKRDNILIDSLVVIPSTSTGRFTSTHQSTIVDQLTIAGPSINPQMTAGPSINPQTTAGSSINPQRTAEPSINPPTTAGPSTSSDSGFAKPTKRKTPAEYQREYRARKKAQRESMRAAKTNDDSMEIADENASNIGDENARINPHVPYTQYHQHKKAHNYIRTKFTENNFGFACSIWDQLWFKQDLRGHFSDNGREVLDRILPNVPKESIELCAMCFQSLEKDVSNYTKYKMGYSQRMVTVKDVVPTKFNSQEDYRKRLGDDIASSLITKRPKTGQFQESDDISTSDENNSDIQNDDLEITDSVSEYLYSDDDLSSTSSDLDSPATMKVCRICLAMNVKMYHISENNLSAMYEIITGRKINKDDKLPQMLCWECVSRLSSCTNFIEKAQKTQWILKNLNQEDRLITINDVKTINKDENGLNSALSTKVNNVNNANLHIIEEIVENDNNCKNSETQTVENVTFIKTENSDEGDEIHNIHNQEANMNIEEEEYIEDEIKTEENVIEEQISCGVGIDPVKSEQLDEGDEESITSQEANMSIEKEQYIQDEIKIEEDGIQEPARCGVGIDPVKSEQLDEGDEESITSEEANMSIEKEQYIQDEIKIEEDGIQEPARCGVGIDPVKSEQLDEGDEESITSQEANMSIEKEQYIQDEIKIEEDGIQEPARCGVGIDPVKSEQLDEGDEESITSQEANMSIEKEQYIQDEIKIEEDGIQEPARCGVRIDPVKSEQVDEGDEEFITIEKVASKHLTPGECGTDSEVIQNIYRLRDVLECIKKYTKS